MSIRRFLVIAAALSALLLVAGCGDSGDSATGSSGGSGDVRDVSVETGSLSKEEFIKQVNPICAKTWKQFEKAFFGAIKEGLEHPPKPTEPLPIKTFFEAEFTEIFQQQIDEINALGAPSGDEAEIDAIFEALEELLAESREDPEAFNEAFFESEASFGKAAELSKAYGFSGCLVPPSPSS